MSVRKTSGHRWALIRDRVLRRDNGLCQMCLRSGRTTAASEVDHIIPDFKGGSDDDENLQSLCHDCHAEKTRADLGHKARPAIGIDGWPI